MHCVECRYFNVTGEQLRCLLGKKMTGACDNGRKSNVFYTARLLCASCEYPYLFKVDVHGFAINRKCPKCGY